MQKSKNKFNLDCFVPRKDIPRFLQGGTLKTLFLTLFLVFSFVPSHSFASTNVFLNIEGCNNNNICEPPDEANLNCSNDCTSCNFNSVCEVLKGETASSCSSDCQTAGGGGASFIFSGEVINVHIITGLTYAIISWDTGVPTFGSVSWGIGDSYNDGIINSNEISIHHLAVIENLSASTTYSYFIAASLPGYYYAKNLGTFTTLSIPVIKIIPSIYDLTATSTLNEIILNWKNPISKDFYGVKIVRSPFFYSASETEGKIIYDGKGTYVRDADVALDEKYYYSAFSYDKDFNYSSGVLTQGIIRSKAVTTTEEVVEGVSKLSLNNYIFMQGDLELAISSTTVLVYPFNDLKIITDVGRFSNQTKTLILRVYDPSIKDKMYSYSFSFDSTRKYFYAVIPNPGNKNIYPFSITSYGFDNKATFMSEGFFDVRAIKEPQQYLLNYMWIIYIILIIFVMFMIIKFYQIRKERNQIQ